LSIRINQRALRVELALRGWTQTTLAIYAGVSGPTANAAATGKPVSAATFHKIAGIALKLDREGQRELIEGLASERVAS
jgi:transcriptional regulator with XRE-family HTH domain